MDRKAWIILFLCSIVLGLNIFYSQKAAKERQEIEKQRQELRLEQDAAAAAGELGVLKTEEPLIIEDTTAHNFNSEKVAYHFTSKHGGLVSVEFKEERAVDSDILNVKLNRFGNHPIGALTSGPDQFVESNMAVENVIEGKEITYLGKLSNGLLARKRYILPDLTSEEAGAEYRLRLEVTLQNTSPNAVNLGDLGIYTGSAAPLYAREWDQQTGFFYHGDGDLEFEHSGFFNGGFFKSSRETWLESSEQVAYAGVMNQFFATVIKPDQKATSSIWSRKKDVEVTTGDKAKTKAAIRGALGLPKELLSAGSSKTLAYDIYTLPKENTMLRAIGGDMGEVMNYGWPIFGFIARILNTVLTYLHDNIFDKISVKWAWGLSIVALTVLLRLIMWPLHAKSQRAMKRMSLLAPKMKSIREKYEDDPQRMNLETMKMYKEYGASPVGGCLPMFLQIPIFFGFYRMLQYAVEFRGEEFLWVGDLSQPDTVAHILGTPINLLPIIMAGTMFGQMAMTPKTGDQTQQKIFMLMPFIFFFFCYSFAAALALYWTVGNIFQIIQTLIMKRAPEPELVKRDMSGKKSFVERMQEMQQMREAGGKGPVIDVKPKKKRGPRTGG